MSDKSTLRLYMPHDGDSTPTGESKVLTVVLGDNNKVYAYEGVFKNAVKENKVITTSYNEAGGIGQLIREKQKQLATSKNGKESLLFLIKPTKRSTYKNVVDALDETTINGVKKYMLLEPSPEENQFLKE